MERCCSVVIPAYRAERTIHRALDSVLRQTTAPLEIVVVDDGSPIPLTTVLSSYGDRVRVLRTNNGGAGAARNRGIEATSGQFIAFLDADDYWEPHKLEGQLAVHRAYPDVGFSFGQYWCEDPNTGARRIGLLNVAYPSEPFRVTGAAAFQAAAHSWTGTIVVSRDRLGRNRFPTDMSTAEDRALWFRLICEGLITFIAEPLATAVSTPDSLSRSDPASDYPNMLRLVRQCADYLGPKATRDWEAKVYRGWASALLGSNKPLEAIRPALHGWLCEPGHSESYRVAASAILQGIFRIRRPRGHIALR